jgi:hypothetical protein
MDCSQDRAFAEKLDESFKLESKRSLIFFNQQNFKMNTQAAAEYEKKLLDSKPRQQYHDDKLKDVRVALWELKQKNKPY